MNQKSRSGSLWVATLSVPLLFGVALFVVRRWGFLAVSDDDYSRVVIAQQFAEHPKFDPSGSSWLPFPFWVTGGAMLLLGGGLGVATKTAWIMSVFCSGLLSWVGLQLRWTHAATISASLAVCFTTTSLWLGNATVPEFPTAALCTVGALSLLGAPDSPLRLVGAVCLLVATASRYEAWPLGFSFLAWSLYDLRANGQAPALRRRLLPLIAAGFPGIWMVHGVLHHNDVFFFFKRVSDYKKALGHALPTWGELMAGYPLALFTVEPLPCALLAVGATFYHLGRPQPHQTPRSKKQLFALVRPLSLVGAQLVLLVWGASRGGAPTHHPERALLSSWMILLFCAVHLLEIGTKSSRSWSRLSIAVPLLVLCHTALSPRLGHLIQESRFRSAELQLGRELAAKEAPAQAVALLTPDYGYFAVMAAGGHPQRFTVLNHHDPRSPEGPPRLLEWLSQHPTGLFVAPPSKAPASAHLLSSAHELGLYQYTAP